MANTLLARRPKGQPTGGQFAAKSNPEADIELEPSWPGLARRAWTHADGSSVEHWLDTNGQLQDPPDCTPAAKRFRSDGTVEHEAHYQACRLQDPPDGSPAVRQFRPDGSVASEWHYQAGQLQDLPDGSPAVRRLRPDGTVEREEHWQDDQKVFPPVA